jgi:hypothetical protein
MGLIEAPDSKWGLELASRSSHIIARKKTPVPFMCEDWRTPEAVWASWRNEASCLCYKEKPNPNAGKNQSIH